MYYMIIHAVSSNVYVVKSAQYYKIGRFINT